MTNKALQLFQPDLMEGLTMKTVLANKDLAIGAPLDPNKPEGDKNIIRSMAVNAESRKAAAKAMGIADNKENASRIDTYLLKQNDNLMNIAVRELVARATSGEWTGKLAKIATNKKGSEQTFTVSLKSVNRTGILPTREQVVKYLAANVKTDDEQQAILLDAERAASAHKSPIDLEVVTKDTAKAK